MFGVLEKKELLQNGFILSGRYANKRDINEKELVQELQARGFSVEKMDKPVDLLIGKHGRTWVAEVKNEGGKLTKSQIAFFDTWRGNHLILRTTQDVAEWAAEIEKERT